MIDDKSIYRECIALVCIKVHATHLNIFNLFHRLYRKIYGVLNGHWYSTIQFCTIYFGNIKNIFDDHVWSKKWVWDQYEAITMRSYTISIIVFQQVKMTAWFKWSLYDDLKTDLTFNREVKIVFVLLDVWIDKNKWYIQILLHTGIKRNTPWCAYVWKNFIIGML